MLTERTLIQLLGQSDPADTSERACALGQMGYMQWLAGLPGAAPYAPAAERALAMAEPFRDASRAVAEFCRLLEVSAAAPLAPLNLSLTLPRRRGGARMRRLSF
ncbi:hypothetical protein [Roseicyclus persicicus]|uniref:Uncharacterized protein n=1 Tax=Roseicyclus persicicus TaxID=2650661 RepID=A0A7X6GY04_9RHOB|nr:hypothetical protein [Roseibacterium persicicum]NKX43714.1 hypothetical protein [Roseibacterium persicicum]